MSDRKQALQDLRDMVAAGKLSPRRLDAEIDAVLRRGTAKMRKAAPWAYNNFPTWQAKESAGCCEVVHTSGDGGLWWESDRFTTSLDAAKALHDAVLPDYAVSLCEEANGEWHCIVGHKVDVKVYEEFWSTGAARAWLLAILSALIAKKERV